MTKMSVSNLQTDFSFDFCVPLLACGHTDTLALLIELIIFTLFFLAGEGKEGTGFSYTLYYTKTANRWKNKKKTKTKHE